MSFEEPTELIEYKGKEVFLIGTAHVSKESSLFVQKQIQERKPEVVCIELCEQRFQAIRNKNSWEQTDLLEVLKKKKLFFLLVTVFLSSMQKKVSEQLDIAAGQEMITAIDEAEKQEIKLDLIDRNFRVTLTRILHNIGFFTRLKLFAYFLSSLFTKEELNQSDIEAMKSQSQIENLVSSMQKYVPDVKKYLIDERDWYMKEKISQLKEKRILAVVGAGHLPGMKKAFEESRQSNLGSLEKIPPKKFSLLGFVLKYAFPVLILFLIFYSFDKDFNTGIKSLSIWILVNGILSSVAVLFTGGHTLSVIVAFIASPITSVIPYIGVSYVVAFVEFYLQKPKVKDLAQISEYIYSFKKWRENRFTKILLISLASGIASSIASFLALYLIAIA